MTNTQDSDPIKIKPINSLITSGTGFEQELLRLLTEFDDWWKLNGYTRPTEATLDDLMTWLKEMNPND